MGIPEGEFHRLFEESREAVYFSTANSQILDINPACVRLFGYTRKEEMLSLNAAADLYWDPQARHRILDELEAQGSVEDVEIEVRTRSGRRVRVQESVSSVVDARGALVGFRTRLRDLSRSRTTEEHLQRTQKMAAIGRLAEGVAHDFNNLLTAINGYSELILAQQSEDDPMRNAVAEIAAAGNRAAELTRRLLTLSRRQAYSPRKIDLNSVLADLEKLLRRVLGEDIDLKTQLDPSSAPIVADQGHIEQLILSLVIDACQGLKDGGEIHLTTSIEKNEGRLEEEEMKLTCRSKESERGTRASGTVWMRYRDGQDSSMPLVQEIVRRSGGYIKVEPSIGYAISAFFPVAEHEPAFSGQAPVPEDLRGTETIILVEDEDAVRELVERILAQQGYRVLVASNAQTAIALCTELSTGPDLLVTDVVMPRVSGPVLANELRARFHDLRVLFISGYSDSNNGIRSSDQPPPPFLQKPFSPKDLVAKVRDVLNGQLTLPLDG